MPKRLSVEIFRDIDCPDIDPRIALDGIEMVNEITNGSLQVRSHKGRVRTSTVGAKTLHLSSREPLISNASGDMNLILTNKELVATDFNMNAIGFAHREKNGGGDAIISIGGTGSIEPHFTTAHELGHLFGLRYGSDGLGAHCNTAGCLMQPRPESILIHPAPRTPMELLFEQLETAPRQDTPFEVRTSTQFCPPCSGELAHRSMMLLRLKNSRK